LGDSLAETETPQQRAALEGVARAVQVAGWCGDQCIQTADPSMTACIRLCDDVVELGEAVLSLVPRTSQFGPATLQTFEQAARACARECGQHAHAHCQECAQVLTDTSDAVQQFVATSGQQPVQ
jgi:hypothetical protein